MPDGSDLFAEVRRRVAGKRDACDREIKLKCDRQYEKNPAQTTRLARFAFALPVLHILAAIHHRVGIVGTSARDTG